MDNKSNSDAGGMTRREWLKKGLGLGLGAALVGGLVAEEKSSQAAEPAKIPWRPLGATGAWVTALGLGGAGLLLGANRAKEASRLAERALELGVKYFDTAPSYGDGNSEKNLGPVVAERRSEIFLATKTHKWSRDDSLRLLEQSLKRLRTTYVDLWQFHSLRSKEEVNLFLGPNGALAAALQAKQEGRVRFIGVTGHYDPAPLAYALGRHAFDTVLIPLNPADRWRLSFIEQVLPVAQATRTAVIAMKVAAEGRIVQPGGIASVSDSLAYVLTLPVSTALIGCDSLEQLEANAAAVLRFQPLNEEQMRRLERLTQPHHRLIAAYKRQD